MSNDKYMNVNRELWNEKTKIHVNSSFYNVNEFKKGEITLKDIELSELNDVKGKSLLHLQCHFGLDTLSWARLGAEVTGIDFSEEAIDYAARLSKELNIPAEFVCSNIYDLPELIKKKFDIVFTSYGVLCWLPDLKKWGKIIAHFLCKGGVFYIVDGHPVNNIFDNEKDMKSLEAKYSYFHSTEPMKWESDGTYADRTAAISNPAFEWTHSMSDIINSLILAGLTIEFVHEFPYCFYDHYPFMEKNDKGWWHLNNVDAEIPLTFSLLAKKV